MATKKCPYCQAFFIPTRRGGKGQKVCGRPLCKKALKAESNARWRRDNPHYWRGDYPRVRRWLDRHPGYLRQYRARHPEYVQRNREAQKERDRKRRAYLDIQAQIRDQLPVITREVSHLGFLDIQDLKAPKPLEMTFLLRTFPCLDIQIQIAKSIVLEENRGIPTGG